MIKSCWKQSWMIPVVMLLLTFGSAFAAQIEGVSFEREVKAQTHVLNLNGYGLLRYLGVIKAYVAAFYLPENVKPEEALNPVPKRLELEYFRSIPAQGFVDATTVSIQRNASPEVFDRIKPKIDALNALYRDISPGDRYALTYVPEKGTTLTWNNIPLGTVESDEFAAELFGIWLGPNPLDEKLKRALLEKK